MDGGIIGIRMFELRHKSRTQGMNDSSREQPTIHAYGLILPTEIALKLLKTPEEKGFNC